MNDEGMEKNFTVYNQLNVPIGSHSGKEIYLGYDSSSRVHADQLQKHIMRKGLAGDTGTLLEILDKVEDDAEQRFKLITDIANIISIDAGSSDPFQIVGILLLDSGMDHTKDLAMYKGVYPGQCSTLEQAWMSRRRDNSNVLVVQTREGEASYNGVNNLVEAWLGTSFDKYNNEYFEPFFQRLRMEEKKCRQQLSRGLPQIPKEPSPTHSS